MKKLSIIFTALVFIAGIAVISCTKESTPASEAIISTTDAIMVDNSANEITGIIDEFEGANSNAFVSPTSKAAVADGPITIVPNLVDAYACATVTLVKTPVLTASVVTGATITFKIDFGTTGCVGKDGKARRGTITSTYAWVKEGGWVRESAIDLYVSDVHYVGTQRTTTGVIGPFNHAYFTEKTTLTVTTKEGSRTWTSERQRELMEGNGGVNPIKIFKITGSSTFTNAKGEKSTYTISVPLYTSSKCKAFIAGTLVTVSAANVTTTIDYGTYTSPTVPCKDGYTISVPAGTDGKEAVKTFVKFAK